MDTLKRRKFVNDVVDDHQSLGIHEDLVMQILLRLPVKDILRCRSVSKHWLNLTSNPYFINKHVLRHHNDDLDLRRMIFLSCSWKKPSEPAIVVSVISEELKTTFQLPSLLKNRMSDDLLNRIMPRIVTCKLVGSTNGLACFFIMVYLTTTITTTEDKEDDGEEKDEEKDLYRPLIIVCNPITAKSRFIPKPKVDSNIPFKNQDEKNDTVYSPRGQPISSILPYFGFDSVHRYNKDGIMIATEYKLVRVFCHDDHSKKEKTTVFRAQVFDRSTNSWEPVKNELELSSLEKTFPISCISVNGFMYWQVTLKDEKCGVISFDIHREIFSVVKLPLILQNQRHWEHHGLLVWKESLAIPAFVFLSDEAMDDYILTLWTMSNTKDSVWTPQFSLDSSILPKGRLKNLLGTGWQDQFLIAISRDDYAITLANAFLCSYDPKTEMVEENLLDDEDKVSLYHGGVNYVPTLAPV